MKCIVTMKPLIKSFPTAVSYAIFNEGEIHILACVCVRLCNVFVLICVRDRVVCDRG